MKEREVLAETKRLYDMGAAIHWLRPKSKIPLESGWGSGPRREWDYICSTWNIENNVGVRLGTPSRFGENYLAVIDVDVKSLDPRHKKEALNAAKKLLLGHVAPTVSSGRGNGSCHYYVATERPFKTFNPAQSSETVKVHMPSKNRISKREKEELTDAELKQGLRLAHAWEISLYSDGRQVVLQPSTHPDSGRAYKWVVPWENVDSLPVIEFEIPKDTGNEPLQSRERGAQETVEDFAVTNVNLDWLDIPKSIALLIKRGLWKGTTITNRSDYLLVATTGLVSAGCTRDDILTVLTEPDYFLGEVAYEHAQTKSRKRAAQWLWNYTVKKVMNERDARQVFLDAGEPKPPATLSPKAARKQQAEMDAAHDWKEDLKRGLGKDGERGPVLNTLKNVYLILKNSFGSPLFRFNEFAKLDEVWQATPWGSFVGAEFQERDVQKIKLWLSDHFGFQAKDDNIWSALVNISDENSYHPIKEYLEGLPPHDGKKRVDYFLERYLKAEAPARYMRAVSRKTIVAMVARIFEPGIKFDTMLVLEGSQGLRKSTAIMTLAGKPWFSDVNLNLKNKDSISDMSGKWVLEQGEMNVMTKHDVAELKQFLSRDTDRMRPSYGRKSQDYPRQSVFIGTTNEDIYLKDTSGSRRFWPVAVKSECDIEAIVKDRDQIFAEALALYKGGEPIWIADQETNHLAAQQQAERETSDELVFVIEKWIEKKSRESDFTSDFDPNRIRMVTLWDADGTLCGAKSVGVKMDYNGQRRVADCLRTLGYVRKTERENGVLSKIWVCYPSKEEKLPLRVTPKDE